MYNFFYKKNQFHKYYTWNGGRSRGVKTHRSKGHRLLRSRFDFLTLRTPITLGYVGGFTWTAARRRSWTWMHSVHGAQFLLPQSNLLSRYKLFAVNITNRAFQNSPLFISPQTCSIINHYLGCLSVNQPLHFLNSGGKRRNVYARNGGKSAWYTARLLTRMMALITLPSLKRKYFPLFTEAIRGTLIRPQSHIYRGGHEGRYMGRAPITRGVARNPVDHPHGGRTKTISWPKSPWGWGTKARKRVTK